MFNWLKKKVKKEMELKQSYPYDSIESAKLRLDQPVQIYYRGSSFFVASDIALQRAVDVLNVSISDLKKDEEFKKNFKS